MVCYSCRAPFDAVDADWCSCLAKERSLVCTNCLACFCKAPPAYKEKFWVEAPPRLFERKTAEGRRQDGSLPDNPPKEQVGRPLVLTVEDVFLTVEPARKGARRSASGTSSEAWCSPSPANSE